MSYQDSRIQIPTLGKMASALELFGPSEEALIQAGIDFVHPAEELEDNNLSRRSKMVEYPNAQQCVCIPNNR